MFVVKAGESHGKAMVGILCNVPVGICVSKKNITALLKERRIALGRSQRQKIESDKISLITGVRGGLTIGNNVAIVVNNAVFDEYQEIMHPFNANLTERQITALRPGHADLGGIYRCGFSDARNVMEGASARNTCLDVALGSIAISMLETLGIKIAIRVKSLGAVKDENEYSFEQILNNRAPAFSQNKKFISECKKEIERAKEEGESLGGAVEIVISNVLPGFGFYLSEKRADSLIASLLMSLQAVKGVFFGEDPFDLKMQATQYLGRTVKCEKGFQTQSLSGGIDGGMTNGDDIKITVAIKPIPTTAKGVETFDIKTGEPCVSAKERADVTAVFAICPVLKCVVALGLSEIICERLGADNMQAIKERYESL